MSGFGNALRRYTLHRRFWRLVTVDGPQACWPWHGPLDAEGEPCYRGRPARVEAYELARGPLPPGTDVERECPHRLCVNPDHMRCPGGADPTPVRPFSFP